jgi:hypothetical protein
MRVPRAYQVLRAQLVLPVLSVPRAKRVMRVLREFLDLKARLVLLVL